MSNNRLILLFFCFLTFGIAANAQQPKATDSIPISKTDSTTTQKIHQLRIGFDIGNILFNNLFPSRKGYEFKADYNWKNDLYFAAEGGWGRGEINYSYLKYKTHGAFIRLGIQQSLFGQLDAKDFDNAFIGVRYGMGFGKRGAADFTVPSPFGSPSDGSAPAQSYFVHWGEIVGGITVGLWKNIYAGWTVSGKFLFNPGTFKTLSPNYIPGYGKGDKKTIFSFNFYISYGIRWKN